MESNWLNQTFFPSKQKVKRFVDKIESARMR